MSSMSRRALARYATERLIAGEPASEIAASLAAAVVESGLNNEIEFLLGDIAWELERKGELASGVVTSARPLSQELESQLISQIKKAAGTRAAAMEKVVDKSVIGGVRIETSGRVWDYTTARKLARLREVF